jgi:hypothetical protein
MRTRLIQIEQRVAELEAMATEAGRLAADFSKGNKEAQPSLFHEMPRLSSRLLQCSIRSGPVAVRCKCSRHLRGQPLILKQGTGASTPADSCSRSTPSSLGAHDFVRLPVRLSVLDSHQGQNLFYRFDGARLSDSGSAGCTGTGRCALGSASPTDTL